MKRISALILSALLTICLMCGCGDDNASSTSSLGSDIISKENVTYIAEDGSSFYRIIRADNDIGSGAAASIVFKGMKSVLGVKLKNLPDSEDDGTDQYEAYMATDSDTVCWENGNLILRGITMDDSTISYTEGGGSDGLMYKHQGGMWMKNIAFNMGYIELRARIPDGDGVYSSFWLNGDNDKRRLELDIFESLGVAGHQYANIHKWTPGETIEHDSLDAQGVPGADRRFTLKDGTLFDQYHTVGLLWDNEKVVYIYDNEVYYTQPIDEFFFDQYMNIIVGFNVGWKGGVLSRMKMLTSH